MSNNNPIKLGRDKNRLNKIEKHIHENIATDLHIDTIAQKFSISPSTLKLLFRHCEGKSYRQYLEEIRLAKALQLLQEENASVKQAMYASGYRNRSTFNEAFKKKHGHSPAYFMK